MAVAQPRVLRHAAKGHDSSALSRFRASFESALESPIYAGFSSPIGIRALYREIEAVSASTPVACLELASLRAVSTSRLSHDAKLYVIARFIIARLIATRNFLKMRLTSLYLDRVYSPAE